VILQFRSRSIQEDSSILEPSNLDDLSLNIQQNLNRLTILKVIDFVTILHNLLLILLLRTPVSDQVSI